jgi:hypothetical protein
MYKYVIAFLSLHDGELKQTLVIDESQLAALNSYLKTEFETLDEVYSYCADSDSWISIIQVGYSLPTGPTLRELVDPQ